MATLLERIKAKQAEKQRMVGQMQAQAVTVGRPPEWVRRNVNRNPTFANPRRAAADITGYGSRG